MAQKCRCLRNQYGQLFMVTHRCPVHTTPSRRAQQRMTVNWLTLLFRIMGAICFLAFCVVAWLTVLSVPVVSHTDTGKGIVIAVVLFIAGWVLWSDWLERGR
jgi:uncharacterized membrane protein (DUF485 family)